MMKKCVLCILDTVDGHCGIFFHAQESPGIADNAANNKQHPVSGSSVGENALVMREVRGE